jgi:hypothetical protein
MFPWINCRLGGAALGSKDSAYNFEGSAEIEIFHERFLASSAIRIANTFEIFVENMIDILR